MLTNAATSSAVQDPFQCPSFHHLDDVRATSQGGDLRKALWEDAMGGTRVFDWRNKGRDVALAVARGLHFLHQQNVVHRRGGTLMSRPPF